MLHVVYHSPCYPSEPCGKLKFELSSFMRKKLGTSENNVFEVRDRAFSCPCRLYHEYLILEFFSC